MRAYSDVWSGGAPAGTAGQMPRRDRERKRFIAAEPKRLRSWSRLGICGASRRPAASVSSVSSVAPCEIRHWRPSMSSATSN